MDNIVDGTVRKMTLLPASRLELTRRGRIAPGFAADLVVFDRQTVADTATFAAPHSYPTGIPYVAVNSVLVIENGTFTGQTPAKSSVGLTIEGREDKGRNRRVKH
jgi:N-acyl-D-amino-acid deacylase